MLAPLSAAKLPNRLERESMISDMTLPLVAPARADATFSLQWR
jgi:hypothetical protein